MSTIPLDLVTNTVALPPPGIDSRLPVRAVLEGRRSTRGFRPDPTGVRWRTSCPCGRRSGSHWPRPSAIRPRNELRGRAGRFPSIMPSTSS